MHGIQTAARALKICKIKNWVLFQVAVDKKAWLAEVAPVLKIVHRPLPNLQNSNSKAAKKLKAQDRTALEGPKKVLEDFCSMNKIDVAQRFKSMHAWPQNVPNSVTPVTTLDTKGVEAMVKEVTEWLGAHNLKLNGKLLLFIITKTGKTFSCHLTSW